MKKSVLLSILVCFSVALFAQEKLAWYGYWGDMKNGTIAPKRVVVAPNGDLYVAANFTGKPVVEDVTLSSNATNSDAVIIKMTADKKILWTLPLADEGDATIKDLVMDEDGNLWALGTFTETIKADAVSLTIREEYEKSLYVFNITPDGKGIRAWQVASNDAISAGNIHVLSGNSIVFTGECTGKVFFDNDPEEARGGINNKQQLFMAKYATDGVLDTVQLRKDRNATYSNICSAVDAQDNIYVGATFTGAATLGTTEYSSENSNGMLIAMNKKGEVQWANLMKGSREDEMGSIAYNPATNEIAIALNHLSEDIKINGEGDEINNDYTRKSAKDITIYNYHAMVLNFDLTGTLKWFYDWGYGSTVMNAQYTDKSGEGYAYSLRCDKDGSYYMTGRMTGRYFDSYAKAQEFNGQTGMINAGIRSVDDQWIQHNTNGGGDNFMLVLSREGKLVNVIRPGGIQTEQTMDMALAPDMKAVYMLQEIQVRHNQMPFTAVDNLFASYTDLAALHKLPKDITEATVLRVYCPENKAGATITDLTDTTHYGEDYNRAYASCMLVKYTMPELAMDTLPDFEVNQPYDYTVKFATTATTQSIYTLEVPYEFAVENGRITGTPTTKDARTFGFIAIDNRPLGYAIQNYPNTDPYKEAIRSNPRATRYMKIKCVDEPSNLNQLMQDSKLYNKVQKVIVDGKLVIIRNGEAFNAQGAKL